MGTVEPFRFIDDLFKYCSTSCSYYECRSIANKKVQLLFCFMGHHQLTSTFSVLPYFIKCTSFACANFIQYKQINKLY